MTSYLARRAKAALRADESARLGPDQTRERMAFTEEQLRTLDCIAAGLPVRNAREAIAAMRLKADFLLSKPVTAVDHHIGIAVIDPYHDEKKAALAASVVVASLPEGQPLAVEEEDKDDNEQ
jgi:hypothetical protein